MTASIRDADGCLEQVDAFVTHAGMSGCGEGLLSGVPMIAAE